MGESVSKCVGSLGRCRHERNTGNRCETNASCRLYIDPARVGQVLKVAAGGTLETAQVGSPI